MGARLESASTSIRARMAASILCGTDVRNGRMNLTAPLKLVADLGQQLDLRRTGGRRWLLTALHQLGRPAHHQEDDEGQDKKAHDLSYELAPAEHRRSG